MPTALNAVHRYSTLGGAGAIRGVIDEGEAACCKGGTICLVRRKPGLRGLNSRVTRKSAGSLTDCWLCAEDAHLDEDAGKVKDASLVHDDSVLQSVMEGTDCLDMAS